MGRMTRGQLYRLLVETSAAGGYPSTAVSAGGRPGCRYRGDGGRKCPVGALIADERYRPEFERLAAKDVGGDPDDYGDELGGLLPAFTKAIADGMPDGLTLGDVWKLQYFHDAGAFPTGSPVGEVPAWDHKEFVGRVNGLACFADVDKVAV